MKPYLHLKRTGTQEEYQNNLDVYCAGLIGVIEDYEKVVNLQRFEKLLPLSKRLSKGVDLEATKEIENLIRKYKKELSWYEHNYPSVSKQKYICEKKKSINLLLS